MKGSRPDLTDSPEKPSAVILTSYGSDCQEIQLKKEWRRERELDSSS